VSAFTVTDETNDDHGLLEIPNPIVDTSKGADGTPAFGVIEDVAGTKIADFLMPSELNITEVTVGGQITIRTLTLTIPEECRGVSSWASSLRKKASVDNDYQSSGGHLPDAHNHAGIHLD
jgi:hypothetical protein